MKILGIETSCDETAAAVVEDGRKVLSNAVYTQIVKHRPFGGVVPEIASRCHAETIFDVVSEALDKAKLSIDEIDAIAVTAFPGLIGALLVGVNFAKGLALSSGKPLIAVNHTRGHIASNYISNEELKPPFLALVVSGGHTDLIAAEDYTHFRVLGSTRDDAAGETFDKAARSMGIPYPGGIELDKIAENGNPMAFVFPKPNIPDSPFDFSFSGLKTAVINQMHNITQRGEEIPKEDIAASLRFAVVSQLISVLEKAISETGYKQIAIAGGVSANSLLRKEAAALSDKHGCRLYMPKLSYCGDNAAMIASQGYYEFIGGNISELSLNASANADIENG